MDMMVLVVDATKGMQAQTTECVVIGEAVISSGADVIVVLNKVGVQQQQQCWTLIVVFDSNCLRVLLRVAKVLEIITLRFPTRALAVTGS